MIQFDPLPELVPLIEDLVRRGVTDPAELVFTLAYRKFEFENGFAVPAGFALPSALATVAQVLGKPLREIETAVVAVAARVDTERELRSRCRALAPRLIALPGIRSVSSPDYGAYPLTVQYRTLAKFRGIPLPQLAEPNAAWVSFLQRWRGASVLDLRLAMRTFAVTLDTGERLEPLEPTVAAETIAVVLGLPLQKVMAEEERQAMAAMMGTMTGEDESSFDRVQMQAGKMLASLPGVRSVERVPAREMDPLPVPEYEGPPAPAPWTVFSEPPSSLRWRMGGGEDVRERFAHFWRGLSPAERREYLDRNPPPTEWREWVGNLLPN